MCRNVIEVGVITYHFLVYGLEHDQMQLTANAWEISTDLYKVWRTFLLLNCFQIQYNLEQEKMI